MSEQPRNGVSTREFYQSQTEQNETFNKKLEKLPTRIEMWLAVGVCAVAGQVLTRVPIPLAPPPQTQAFLNWLF